MVRLFVCVFNGYPLIYLQCITPSGSGGGGSTEVEEPNAGSVSLEAIERWREEDQGPEKEGALNRSKAAAHPATSHDPEWAPR